MMTREPVKMAETVRDPGPALEMIRRAPRVFVTFHSSPDGDAIGSALGLAELSEALHDMESRPLSCFAGVSARS